MINSKETEQPVIDKAGEEYWTAFWKVSELPPPFPVRRTGINDYPYKIMDGLFREIFGNGKFSGKKILEIGCGNSIFLSYFAKEFNLEVYGLDYSKYGCEQTKRILQRDGVAGTIIEGDAFNPPQDLLNSFDYVASFGVVEHFADTVKTLESFSRFLKPGGVLITSIPNLAGVTGALQKWMNRPVYDIHVPLDQKTLNDAIQKAGLKLITSKYFMSVSFAVTLTGTKGEKIPYYTIKNFFLKGIRHFSKLIWMIEKVTTPFPAGKLLSGGVMTSARKQ